MKKNTKWFGADASNRESLFEYGFLMRWCPEYKEYQVIHVAEDCSDEDRKMYTYSYFNPTDWIGYLKAELGNNCFPDANMVANNCGMSVESYFKILEANPEFLLSSLSAEYGFTNIFGHCYNGSYTKGEICRRLNKALN